MPAKNGSSFLLPTLALCIAGTAACRYDGDKRALAETLPAAGAVGPQAEATYPVATPASTGAVAQRSRLRRVWAGERFSFYQSSTSPDGRYLLEIDWSSGDLAVRDLHTGRLHRLTDKGSWEVSREYPEGTRFSPDGRRVAYTWYNETKDVMEVRVMKFALDQAGVPRGSEPRVAYAGGPLIAYWLFGWTRDDEVLIGLEQPDKTWALGFVSLASGSLRVLKSFDWQPPRARLSADERYIAYDHPPALGSEDRDIYVLSTDGSRESVLVDGPGDDVVLGWVPGDGSLLYYSERSGTPSVWRQPMSDGRPAGPAVLVREDVRKLEPLGLAGDTYYFGVVVDAPAFRTATIDFEGRRLARQAPTFEAPYGGSIVGKPAWSPDGQYLVHAATGPTGPRIYVRAIDGVVIRDWGLDRGFLGPTLRWAPDGRAVFLAVADSRGRRTISRLDLESGEREKVRLDPESFFFSISPDGRTLYFQQASSNVSVDRAPVEIVARDLMTGSERTIHGVPYAGPVEVSPDGAWLAYVERQPGPAQAIRLVPVDGGEPRVLHRIERGNVPEIVGWTPDGRYVLFVLNPPSPKDGTASALELWRVSRRGADAEQIAVMADAVANSSVGATALHPDGRTVAFLAGPTRGEIWALDHIAATEEDETQPQIR